MANIKKLKANGQDIVPITHEQAVLDSNGVTLDSKLNAINNAISRLENNSTSSTPSLVGNALTLGNYTIKYDVIHACNLVLIGGRYGRFIKPINQNKRG